MVGIAVTGFTSSEWEALAFQTPHRRRSPFQFLFLYPAGVATRRRRGRPPGRGGTCTMRRGRRRGLGLRVVCSGVALSLQPTRRVEADWRAGQHMDHRSRSHALRHCRLAVDGVAGRRMGDSREYRCSRQLSAKRACMRDAWIVHRDSCFVRETETVTILIGAKQSRRGNGGGRLVVVVEWCKVPVEKSDY